MVRPCFLVIDREFPGNISTRKLVIETAKFNVITAYSAREALETLQLFPAIAGVVADADMPDMPCGSLVGELKAIKPGLPVVVISGPADPECAGADHQVESFDPRKLLEALKKLKPAEVNEIERHEEKLNRDEKRSGGV
jgi:DNA-binding NtrC family response regulator